MGGRLRRIAMVGCGGGCGGWWVWLLSPWPSLSCRRGVVVKREVVVVDLYSDFI
jgi:hypothetical protein